MSKSVESKFKLFGGYGLMLLINLVPIGLIIALIITNEVKTKLPLYLMLIGFQLVLFWLLSTQCRRIVFLENRMIVINPLLNFIKKEIEYNKFDYCFSVFEAAGKGVEVYYESIWCIKDSKLKFRFSSYYYSNFHQMKESLNVDYKGVNHISKWDQTTGLMFNSKVPENFIEN